MYKLTDLKYESDLEHIRTRPAMYVGDASTRGLHHLFNELLDNAIDQFLAKRATCVSVETNGSTLTFSDDGPGLPFDQPCPRAGSLATRYLTELRRDSPTVDGHTPHVHMGAWGCGLRIVSALTKTCQVTSWRAGSRWQQAFTRGIADSAANSLNACEGQGTAFRLAVDREVFSGKWSQDVVDRRLRDAAYLFPGLRVQSPNLQFCAPRGLADLALDFTHAAKSDSADRVWWFHDHSDELEIQAAVAGTTAGETDWRAFANGCASVEQGTHLTALKRVVAACGVKPAIALIHVIMHNPRLAGPTRTKLDAPELISPIFQALRPSLAQFVADE